MLGTQQYLTGGVTSWPNRSWPRCREKSSTSSCKTGEDGAGVSGCAHPGGHEDGKRHPRRPRPGKIKEIKVKKDDTVATQQVLMVLE
ncbi:MAG: hypothetical protein MZV70_15195 [Desulfobacterales bacterium]|nr:hypothetical protein [Desulfobacterales bacterium]